MSYGSELTGYLELFEAAPRSVSSVAPKGKIDVNVLEIQYILLGLGWPSEKMAADGDYGPKTAAAWTYVAKQHMFPDTAISRVSGKVARVSTHAYVALKTEYGNRRGAGKLANQPAPAPNPLLKLKADPRPAAKPAQVPVRRTPGGWPSAEPVVKPAAPVPAVLPRGKDLPAVPSTSGLVQQTVFDMQKLLKSLGWSKLTVDKKYGPITKGAWETSARSRKLPMDFVRVTGLTVAVHPSTLAKFRADAATRATQQKDRPTALPFVPSKLTPTGTTPKPGAVSKSVAELQSLLYGVGWTTKKLKSDGSFGPQTKTAWQTSAKTRKVPTLFERVDGKTAQVAESAYNKIKADAEARKTVIPGPTPGPTPGPVGGVYPRPVSDVYSVLYALGWTTKKLPKSDIYTDTLGKAYGISTKSRKLNSKITPMGPKATKVFVDNKDFKVLQDEAEKKGTLPPTPTADTPVKPAPIPGSTDLIVKSVADAQKVLHKLGWRKATVASDGDYGPKTAGAWAESAKKRSLDPTFTRVSRKTVKLSAPTYAAFLKESLGGKATNTDTGAKPDTGASTKTDTGASTKTDTGASASMSDLAKAMVKVSNTQVPVEAIQQSLSVLKTPVPITGSWNDTTAEAFLTAFYKAENLRSAVREALPALVAADNRSIMLGANQAKEIDTLRQLWAANQSVDGGDPISRGPQRGDTDMPGGGSIPGGSGAGAPGGGIPGGSTPGGGSGGGGGGGGSPWGTDPGGDPSGGRSDMPGSAEQPPPPPTSGDLDAGEVWQNAVSALKSFSDRMPEFEANMLKARASGEGATPTQEADYAALIKSADRVKQRIAEMIEKSPALRSAVDAAAASTGFSGFSGFSELEAYFGDVQSASAKVLDMLKEPFSTGLQGFSQAAPAVAWAARLAAPAWQGVLTLLSNPTIRAVAVTAVASDAAVKGLNVALHGETLAYLENQSKLIEGGHGSEAPKAPIGGLAMVVMGLVAVGGLAIYLKSKKGQTGPSAGSRSSTKAIGPGGQNAYSR